MYRYITDVLTVDWTVGRISVPRAIRNQARILRASSLLQSKYHDPGVIYH